MELDNAFLALLQENPSSGFRPLNKSCCGDVDKSLAL